MMLKCQKCGFENQLGSIFCRGCGEKLDTSCLDHPDSIDKDSKKNKGKAGKIISVIVTIVLIVVLLGAGAAFAMFSIPADSVYQESKADVEKIVSSLNRGRETSLTPDQISAWYQQYIFSENKIEGINGVMFKGTGDKLTIYIYANKNGREVVISAIGTIAKGTGDKKVDFKVEGYKQGYVPLFCCKDEAEKLCEKVLDADKFEDAFEKAESASFKNGKLTFKFPAKASRRNKSK